MTIKDIDTTDTQPENDDVAIVVDRPKPSGLKWEKSKFDADRVRKAGAAYAAGVAEINVL